MTSGEYDGVGIYVNGMLVWQDVFAVSKYVVPGDLLVVTLGDIVSQIEMYHRYDGPLTVRLHKYEEEPAETYADIDWPAEGF